MAEVASSVVQEVLGDRARDVDQPIIDYIINVLADEDFDFGIDGDGAFEAVGELLVDSGCVRDDAEGHLVCSKISEKFGKHRLVKPKEAVRSLATPLRMYDGMDETETRKKQPEALDGPVLSERDKAKLDRRKRKEERQRQAQYQMHLAEMEAVRAGMPVVCVNHGGNEGSAVRDIHMENFTVSVGGRDLITDVSVTLSFGRHYGLVGRNGTGKTSFLRHMAMHAIDGIPKNCQILHVEQEVEGDDTTALQCVLNSDIERIQLLEEEAHLLSQQRDLEDDEETGKSNSKANGSMDKNAISKRLEEIYKRLEFIDADSAESRAASILAENKLQVLRKLTPFQNGLFRSGIIGNNSFCRSITTVGHPEASLGQDNTTSPDVDQPQRIKFKRLDKTAKHIMNILDKEAVEKVQAEREIPDIRPGYIVQLKVEVPENKRRVSVLKGIVIARRNAGLNTTFRLRRLVAGVGVESVFPLYSPNIKEMKVLDKKKVRRAKLYYLRDRMNPLKK